MQSGVFCWMKFSNFSPNGPVIYNEWINKKKENEKLRGKGYQIEYRKYIKKENP